MKLSPKQCKALQLVAEGRFLPGLAREDDGWHARWRAIGVDDDSVNLWVDEYVRSANVTRLTEDAENQHHETLHDAWMMALKSTTGLIVWDDAECAAFKAELEVWSGNADEDVAARQAIVFSLRDCGARKISLECAYPVNRRSLRALGQAVYVWPPLGGLKARGLGHLAIDLRHTEAEEFVSRGARDLLNAGYSVTGVDIKAPITASAEVKPEKVELTVRVKGEVVSASEIRFLLDQNSSLVYFRDHWIEVDRGILKEALRALEKKRNMKKSELLSFALGFGHVGRLELDEIRAHGWLRGLVNELKANGKLELSATSAPRGFVGELRDYQRNGIAWLDFLTAHGFGALLADDMGLGKTVEVIAWMLSRRSKPTLVVAPLTLLANWRHELKRFAPSLKVYVHQGGARHFASGFLRAVKSADVTLTSYNLLVRDYQEFSEVKWQAMVIDEAQAIKNPDTQIARAVRSLTPAERIAMTGTPIENSVADIWSIEEFLNPGLLGERKSFIERFVRPIGTDTHSIAAKRLRHSLEPFVLRRLKSDKRIAAELGEKREVREYCDLTDAQRRDYESALATFRGTEHERGDVFALITRLKLICDGQGKLERLADLLNDVFANGESALIFTQYAKVGEWLRGELRKRFNREFPFLHGSLSAAERETEIARFNRRGPSAFILSLKAGGFGLNLTKATHVIHFDRWWNPAVENQATDRAHRIGQDKTVFVHLFISSGTLEEHVDEILLKKATVADSVITEAEWLEAAKLDE